MPFFRKNNADTKKKSIKKQKSQAALQAQRINFISTKFKYCFSFFKRADIRASLTLEAALSLSLFIFAMVLIMISFKIMDSARKLQSVCESVNKDACKYAYLVYRYREGGGEAKVKKEGDIIDKEKEESVELSETFQSLIGSGMLGIYASKKAQEIIDDKHISDISGLRTECMADGEMIIIRLHYKYNLPFAVFGLGHMNQNVMSSRRAWIGSEGEVEKEDDKGEEKDEIVYIGKTSTKYHRDRRCHYLYNDIKSIPRIAVSDHRNSYGSGYRACARCGASAGNTVYILPSGTSYHSSRNCSAILAYVRAVKLSEVEYMGACSYCGGSH